MKRIREINGRALLMTFLVIFAGLGISTAQAQLDQKRPAAQAHSDQQRPAVEVARASFILVLDSLTNRIFAVLSELSNLVPSSRVIVYGYNMAELEEEVLLHILSLASRGRIRIAVATPVGGPEGDYTGRAIRVSKGADESQILEGIKTVFSEPETVMVFDKRIWDREFVVKFFVKWSFWSEDNFKFAPEEGD